MILLLGFYIAYKNQERQNAEKMKQENNGYYEGKNDDVDREVTGNIEHKGDYELFGLGLGIGRTGKKVDACQEKKLR